MTTKQVAEFCGVSISTVLRWRCCSNQGTIPQFGDLIS
ncbi:helix-turn-helix domain-containing protein [Escherichia coli]